MQKLAQYVIMFLSVNFYCANAQNIDSLKFALKNAIHDTTRCNILLQLSEIAPDGEWELFNEQLKKISEQRLSNISPDQIEYKFYKKHLASAYNNIGYYYDYNSDFKGALENYKKSLTIEEEIGNNYGVATVLNNIGYLYEARGEINQAIEYYTKSLKIFRQIGDKQGEAILLNNIGGIYSNQGDITKSLDYYSESLKIKEELKDKRGISHSLNNIGNIYSSQGEYGEALKYFNKSLRIRDEMNDMNGAAEALYNIGTAYSSQGNFVEALKKYTMSLELREKLQDLNGIAQSYHGIAFVYQSQNDLDRALQYYSKSLEIRRDIGDKKGMAYTIKNIGTIYFTKKNYQKALEYTKESMSLGQELAFPEIIKNAANLLRSIYKTTGNYKLATENFELYIQMRDSLNNIETQKATIKQHEKYEYEKKQALNEEKHNAELKIQEEKSEADRKKQNIIILSVSVVLLLVLFFSVLLFNRFKTTQKQKLVIEQKEKETQEQKIIIEEKQKEIIDSINYAKRIQYTLLAHDEFLKENLSNHFTLFQPKDIVSGDFYWATKNNDKFYLAICDSTGHGVPGAFMSLLNIGFLNEAINEKGIVKPNEIFDFVRMKLTETISKEGQKDGFDGVLVCLDQKKKTITYAAANNAPVLISNGEQRKLEHDRMPVGVGEKTTNFTLHTIDAQKGDMLYLYTDGYADQFGGPKGKKFKYKQLNELLLANHTKPIIEQCKILKSTFEEWQGNLEQVDDVCLMGIKI